MPRGCNALSTSGLREWRDALHLGTPPSPDQATVEGCHATSIIDFLPLPELIEDFGKLGCNVVEMVLASEMRAELAAAPARYARYQREYLGWGVFALMNRLSGPIPKGQQPGMRQTLKVKSLHPRPAGQADRDLKATL